MNCVNKPLKYILLHYVTKERDIYGLKIVSMMVVMACLFNMPVVILAQGVSSHVETKNGIDLPVIENVYTKLTFDPAQGGRCISFKFKDTGEEIVDDKDSSGMFIDHWAKYTWPSGLMHLPYQYEIVGDGRAEVGIRLWVRVPIKGGGVEVRVNQYPLKYQLRQIWWG